MTNIPLLLSSIENVQLPKQTTTTNSILNSFTTFTNISHRANRLDKNADCIGILGTLFCMWGPSFLDVLFAYQHFSLVLLVLIKTTNKKNYDDDDENIKNPQKLFSKELNYKLLKSKYSYIKGTGCINYQSCILIA